MGKDFDSWNIQKKKLQERIFSDFIHTREIWWCSLGYNIGDEEDGKNEDFERPVLVIKKYNNRIVLVVPLSSKIKDNPYYVIHDYNGVKSAAIISQVRLVSTKRLLRKIRKMDTIQFQHIISSLKSMI